MALGIKRLWGQKADAEERKARLNRHVDNDYLTDIIAHARNAMRDRAALSPEDKKQFDFIAHVIAVMNEQDGIRVQFRSIDFPFRDEPKLIINVDIAANGLNRKIKEMVIVANFVGKKPLVEVNGFRFNLGGGHYMESERSWFSDGLDIDDPQDRADFLRHIGLYIAGKMQQQRYQDRAKGYIHQQLAIEERLAAVKAGRLRKNSPK